MTPMTQDAPYHRRRHPPPPPASVHSGHPLLCRTRPSLLPDFLFLSFPLSVKLISLLSDDKSICLRMSSSGRCEAERQLEPEQWRCFCSLHKGECECVWNGERESPHHPGLLSSTGWFHNLLCERSRSREAHTLNVCMCVCVGGVCVVVWRTWKVWHMKSKPGWRPVSVSKPAD